MIDPLVMSLLAALTVAPAAVSALVGPVERNLRFWTLTGLAAAGPTVLCLVLAGAGWKTGFAAALWVTIAGSVVIFLALSAATRHAWRLAPILMPYLLLLSVSATVWSQAVSGQSLSAEAPPVWISIHIATSVTTYVLLTLAAIASAAVQVQEWALRRKRRFPLLARLPSMADAEVLELGLLAAAETVLGIGILSGMAVEYLTSGALLELDHKTIFVLVAFVLIGILLIANYWVGLRGRRAARLVLAGYLLVTLAYPGVKFVTDVLLA